MVRRNYYTVMNSIISGSSSSNAGKYHTGAVTEKLISAVYFVVPLTCVCVCVSTDKRFIPAIAKQSSELYSYLSSVRKMASLYPIIRIVYLISEVGC